jgi:CsoR family transcriptional regulator, copper-sensing transcriptional repressor
MATATEAPGARLRSRGHDVHVVRGRIERKLNKLEGVQATVNYAAEQAAVRYDPTRVAVTDLLTHGYVSDKDSLIKRLHRIEGQVRGIEKMVDEERSCIEILTQVGAVSTALGSLSVKLLEDHVRHCADALTAGDAKIAAEKSEDLLAAVQRFSRTR